MTENQPASEQTPDTPVVNDSDFGAFEPTLPLGIENLDRLRLSFSRIDTYQNCGLKFRYAYVDKLPTKPSPQLSFGKSVHAALEAFFDRKLPEPPPVDLLLDTLYEHWDKSGFSGLDRDEQMAYYRHAQDVLRRFYARTIDHFRLPLATEQWFDMPMGQNITIVGSIDRVDVDETGALHVIDYKTNRKAKTYRDVSRSLQLALYALACEHLYGRLPETVALDFVVPGVSVAVPVNDMDLAAARQVVADTAEAIRAGRFAPEPNPLCNWCDFQALCPAWDGPDDDSFAALTLQLESDRRRLAREVADFRTREQAHERLRHELVTDLAPQGSPHDEPQS